MSTHCDCKEKISDRNPCTCDLSAWTSISTARPTIDGEYMTRFYGSFGVDHIKQKFSLIPRKQSLWFGKESNLHWEFENEYDFVTHWMPLPEPPKDESSCARRATEDR